MFLVITLKIGLKKIDSQGRILLPVEWRKKLASNQVIIIEEDEQLIIKPISESNLTKYFDSIEIDVDAEVFSDYKSLKKELLSGSEENEIH